MSPEAAAHGVPGSLPRGRGLRGSAAPSFSRRKHIDAPAHPGRKGVTLARPLEGLVHCILTSLYSGQCGCPPGHAHRVIPEIVDFLATGMPPPTRPYPTGCAPPNHRGCSADLTRFGAAHRNGTVLYAATWISSDASVRAHLPNGNLVLMVHVAKAWRTTGPWVFVGSMRWTTFCCLIEIPQAQSRKSGRERSAAQDQPGRGAMSRKTGISLFAGLWPWFSSPSSRAESAMWRGWP